MDGPFIFFKKYFKKKLCHFFIHTATSFMEFWKRRQAVIAWEWDLTNFEEDMLCRVSTRKQ